MNNREKLHQMLDEALDEIERAEHLGFVVAPSIEIPEKLEPDGPAKDVSRLWLAICSLENLGWALSAVWARVQMRIDGDAVQVSEVFEERIQDMYQNYLLNEGSMSDR